MAERVGAYGAIDRSEYQTCSRICRYGWWWFVPAHLATHARASTPLAMIRSVRRCYHWSGLEQICYDADSSVLVQRPMV